MEHIEENKLRHCGYALFAAICASKIAAVAQWYGARLEIWFPRGSGVRISPAASSSVLAATRFEPPQLPEKTCLSSSSSPRLLPRPAANGDRPRSSQDRSVRAALRQHKLIRRCAGDGLPRCGRRILRLLSRLSSSRAV